jgi:DNA helicase-2/ATP-dependent DNA helicase PcrA
MDLESVLLSNLNPEQSQAVTHHGTPLLIIAGAGSGKTRVITHRIAWLSHVVGIPLWEILAVTFTNKAAREMRHRVCSLLGMPDNPSLAISTFHSRCAMILRREAEAAALDRNFAILDERDQTTAIRKAMEEEGVSDKRVRPAQVMNFITLAKMRLLSPADCAEEFNSDEIPYAALYKRYAEILEKNNSLDFEDLIYRTVILLRDNASVRAVWQRKYRYVMIDEFQDTNFSQFELVKLIVGDDHQICVVGDEDQSIYSWRGADISNLLSFRETYPDADLIRLEQNYRSVGNVLRAADAVIRNNTQRIGKTLWTEREDGNPLRVIVGEDERDEAEQVARAITGLIVRDGVGPEEVAVFFRSHRLSRALEDALIRSKVPYRLVGGVRFYDRAEIKDLLSFLRLAIQPENNLALERVLNVPTRGLGKKSQDEIQQLAAMRGTSLHDACAHALETGAVKGRGAEGLRKFLAAIGEWRAMAKTATVSEVFRAILADTRYVEETLGDAKSLDAEARKDNIDEFRTVLVEFEQNSPEHTVADFLEAMTLDATRSEGGDGARISLMTIHNAKGLEFDHVFIVGLENGVFPNSRTMETPDQFEEERRLFYVALTRAREQLTVCRAKRRQFQGFYDNTEPSLFLRELPEELFAQGDLRRLGILDGAGSRRIGGAERFSQRAFGAGSAGPSRGGYQPSSPARPLGLAGGRGPLGSAGAGGQSINVGDRVEHRIMGTGTVTEKGGRPGNERVYVEFDDGRSQDFLLKFKPLTKL